MPIGQHMGNLRRKGGLGKTPERAAARAVGRKRQEGSGRVRAVTATTELFSEAPIG
jgi:hypothetical protein